MINCCKCEETNKIIKNEFDIIGKTFYKINNTTIMCYRHWYQASKPEFKVKGDYHMVTKDMKIKKNADNQTENQNSDHKR